MPHRVNHSLTWVVFFVYICFMVIDLLDKLNESGDLKSLFNAGMISGKVINQRKIYHTYKNRLLSVSKSQSIIDASKVHRVTTRTTYNVIKSMES